MFSFSRCALLGATCFLLLPFTCLSFSGIRPQRINAYSSPLFRRSSRIVEPKTIHLAAAESSDLNDEPINSEPAPEAASFPKKVEKESKSLFERLDYFGQSLKPRAVEKKRELASAKTRKEKFWLGFQSCAYFFGFMLYRAYRGFFVLLPAVFREVYAKMELLDSPFVDEPGTQDVNPETGKVRWRTRITVSVLTAVVTLTYVVGGLANVLAKFVKSLTQTSSPTSSFEAAADETAKYEEKIAKMTKKDVNGTLPSSGGSSLAP